MANQKRIAIISIYSFPEGGAATNRILAYAKGLVCNGAAVDVFCVFPTDSWVPGTKLSPVGKFDGINYLYTSGRYRNRYKLIRGLTRITRFRYIYGYLTAQKEIKKRARSREYSCLVISTDQIISLYVFARLAAGINSKAIFIFDEFPTPIRHKLKNKIPFWKEFLYRIVLQQVDAYISISSELQNYYCSFINRPTFVLPLIVDTLRFCFDENQRAITENYLCYMGNMELAKDDVDNIITAFSFIVPLYPNLELHLYGRPSIQAKKKLSTLISSLGLESKIHFKGRINSFLVPEVLSRAAVLVSSQPLTKRASGGFPTKLGEYLSMGVPTLLTDVGENAKYVADKEHVFFAMPHNPQSYANKLNHILSNYDEALKVADAGRALILSNYSHVAQGKRLLNFIKEQTIKSPKLHQSGTKKR